MQGLLGLHYVIVGFVGPQGCGKTLAMTYFLLDEYLTLGRPLYTNYHLGCDDAKACGGIVHDSLHHVRIPEPDPDTEGVQFDITRGSIGVDEILAWFNRLHTQSLVNKGFSTFITQARKRRVNFYYTGQWFRQAELALREVSDLLVECENKIVYCDQDHAWMTEDSRCPTCEYYIILRFYKRPFNLDLPPVTTKAIRQEPLWPLYDTEEIVKPLKVSRSKLGPTPNPPRQPFQGIPKGTLHHGTKVLSS